MSSFSRFLNRMRSVRRAADNHLSNRPVTGDLPLIVSLTSHSARVNRVWHTLERISANTVKPQQVILWLDERWKTEALPASLKRLERRGLSIRYAPDVGPHTKFHYAMPISAELGQPIMTIDDDAIYPSWLIGRLFDAYTDFPGVISCIRARVPAFDQHGALLSYNRWPMCSFTEPMHSVFFTGVGGVIYPPEFADMVASAGDGFLRTCPKADDVWLNHLALKHGVKARQISARAFRFLDVSNTQDVALWGENERGLNDVQIAATFEPADIAKLANEAQRAALLLARPREASAPDDGARDALGGQQR